MKLHFLWIALLTAITVFFSRETITEIALNETNGSVLFIMKFKKMQHKPQKRHKALQPLSREHHHGLLLSWKIRIGFNKNIEPERMRTYANWFYENHLIPHFEMEEKHIFTILDSDHELVKRALSDHRRLKRLFAETGDDTKTLSIIEEKLEQHIRFEERVLFPEIQKIATESQMQHIEKIHHLDIFEDNLDDVFWA